MKYKLVRITTVPLSLEKLIRGQMQFMSSHGFEVTMISSSYKRAVQLEQRENARFIPVEMTRAVTPFKDLISLIKMVSILRRIKPHIVHTHTPKAGLIGMLAARMAGVPIRLHTVAGLPLMEATGIKRRILEMVERITYACAIKVYPNSSNLKNFILKSEFCKKEKLQVIGNGSSNGIDTAYFSRTSERELQAKELREKYGISPDCFVFAFVGRLVKDKGIEELVAAFKRLSQQHNQIRLLLVGPFEPERDALGHSSEREIESNPRIISVGYQDDVRPYLALSNALVFPSYREGFPNVPMQAGCFDLPSIVTDINGCNEIIEHEMNGLIIPVKNSKALESSMERLLTDRSLYQKLKENARKVIVARYEQLYIWSLILDEYRNHLKRHGVVS